MAGVVVAINEVTTRSGLVFGLVRLMGLASRVAHRTVDIRRVSDVHSGGHVSLSRVMCLSPTRRNGSMSGLKIGVVGATGMVGRQYLEILESSALSVGDLRLYASARSVGSRVRFVRGCFTG